MVLKDILPQGADLRITGDPNVRISGISFDSRRVSTGDLFVAIAGEKADGNRYLDEAIRRGAVALASERPLETKPGITFLQVGNAREFLAVISVAFCGNPARSLNLAGLTGTNGKTTTSFLLDSIFRCAGFRSCLLGTVEGRILDQSFPVVHTTPEAPDLQAFLREAVHRGCTHGVMEISSHALAMKRVYGLPVTVAVFTNLSPDHLDFHRDMESYYRAKRLLFVEEGHNQVRTAVVNVDDPWGRRLVADVDCPCTTFGFAPEAAVRVLKADYGVRETIATGRMPEGDLNLRLRLIGRPNLYNALAALCAALALGIPHDAARAGIEALGGVPGRMERVDCGQDFAVVVDYAHTPDALQSTLDTLSQLPHQRIITVFGCGGDRDRGKRPIMGEIASHSSRIVIATSDNPRSEDPLGILAEIEPGLKRGGAQYRIEPDRREAIREALQCARPDDVVLIAGKGHEGYQVIGTRVLPFDDRQVAREWLGQHAAAGEPLN